MLGKEMHYDCIVLNMGTRFKGFFDILDRCSDIYLVQKKAESASGESTSLQRS